MSDKILDLASDGANFATTDTVASAVEFLQGFVTAVEAMYPVGSVIINTTGVNPSEYLGGTWVQYGQEKFILGAGGTIAANTEGGSLRHRHFTGVGVSSDGIFILASSGNAKYSAFSRYYDWAIMNGTTANAISDKVVESSKIWEVSSGNSGSHPDGYTSECEITDTSGNGEDLRPPYICAYFWKRTA